MFKPSKSNMFRFTLIGYLLLCPLAAMGFIMSPVKAQETPTPSTPAETETPAVEETPPASIFSLEGGNQLMSEAEAAIDSQDYELAAEKLQSARQVFNQLSNFYLQLFNSFSGLDNNIANAQRRRALETGQLRDKATYQLALVHRAQNKSELSIPLLIQIIGSQSPTSGLGKKAYQQLNEIGFVSEPLSDTPARPAPPPATTPAPAPAPTSPNQPTE